MDLYNVNSFSQTLESGGGNILLYRELVDVLFSEAEIYQRLLEQEKKKYAAIENQDMDSLQEITIEQNSLLKERDTIEEERNQNFKLLEKKFEGKEIKKLSDLLDLNISERFLHELTQVDQKIRSNIEQLQRLVIINHNIITYNTNFFQQLLESATCRSVHAYTYNLHDQGNQAKENSGSPKPIFLNANC